MDKRAVSWVSHAAWERVEACRRVEIIAHEGGEVCAMAAAVFLGAFDDVGIEVEVLGGLGHG
ncbi:MAG: hypothetical protein M3373_00755 [Gemmatimonadota bacterium]|nr:hypothetical protein [Gemmatimonadota bacterium]